MKLWAHNHEEGVLLELLEFTIQNLAQGQIETYFACRKITKVGSDNVILHFWSTAKVHKSQKPRDQNFHQHASKCIRIQKCQNF